MEFLLRRGRVLSSVVSGALRNGVIAPSQPTRLAARPNGLGAGYGLLGVAPDATSARLGRFHEITDRLKDDPEPRIVLLLERLQLARQIGVGLEPVPQTNESPHNLNVNLHGSFALQDAGQHRDSLLGEGVGEVLDVPLYRLNQHLRLDLLEFGQVWT